MTSLTPEALHALHMAMQNEATSIQIYHKMLKQVNNSKTRQMLQNLIEEEHQHENSMKAKIVEAGLDLPEYIDDNSEFSNWEQLMDMELENFTITELIGLAIQNEKINQDFYKAQYDRLKNKELKAIFKWLIEQEDKHIKNLRNERNSHTLYEEVRLQDDELD